MGMNSWRQGLLGLLLGAGLLFGQTATAAGPNAMQLIEEYGLPTGYHMMAPRDAKVLIDAGGVQILDVRTPEEFAESILQESSIFRLTKSVRAWFKARPTSISLC